jgi:hypothetical protein
VIAHLREKSIPVDGLLGKEIGNYLVEGYLRGIEDLPLLVGIAIVAGHSKISDMAAMMVSLPGLSPSIEAQRCKKIREVAEYLSRHFVNHAPPTWWPLPWTPPWWKRSETRWQERDANEYERLLLDLRERWNDMPQVADL